jgi:putative transposase
MPGYVWHITHRCHKAEFLLKFAQTRQRYIHWLCQARKRFDVEILNYTITSNHIHLIVRDGGEGKNTTQKNNDKARPGKIDTMKFRGINAATRSLD